MLHDCPEGRSALFLICLSSQQVLSLPFVAPVAYFTGLMHSSRRPLRQSTDLRSGKSKVDRCSVYGMWRSFGASHDCLRHTTQRRYALGSIMPCSAYLRIG